METKSREHPRDSGWGGGYVASPERAHTSPRPRGRDAAFRALAGLRARTAEAPGRKTHFTPERLSADWNWSPFCRRIRALKLSPCPESPLNESTSWVQPPAEIVRLCPHQLQSEKWHSVQKRASDFMVAPTIILSLCYRHSMPTTLFIYLFINLILFMHDFFWGGANWEENSLCLLMTGERRPSPRHS